MPYASGKGLPGETASKLGHLAVIKSKWVQALVNEFEHARPAESDTSATQWVEFDLDVAEPLQSVWAVDGSYVTVKSQDKPPKEVSFVKTALLTVDRNRLGMLDKQHPHPLLLQDVLTGSAIFHATVFPLKNIRTSLGSNYATVRHIVHDSLPIDEDGAFYETLKWIAYQKWNSAATSVSPEFGCPHCGRDHPGLPFNADDGTCPHCGKTVFLTDIIGFHLDMDEDSAPESVVSSYMLVMEHLMLFTAIRLLWHHSDQKLLSNTLFIKDGPLTLRSQYSKFVPRIRAFLEHAKSQGRPIYVIGQEKSGAFYDHLQSITRFAPPGRRGDRPSFSVLTHDYVRREVYRTPGLSNPYGLRTNWGEKVYVKLDPNTALVLNVPTGRYSRCDHFPTQTDLIGFERILASLQGIVSHRFEGALFPIELANGIASMSSYPSAKILQDFVDSPNN